MNKHWLAWTVGSALLVSFSAAALAQPQDQDHHQPNDAHQGHAHQRGMYEHGRSEGWYKKGGHMPSEYRGKTYVVTDWHQQHLRQPPRGYHWVRSDNGDFLLVAVTSGIIADLLLHH